MGPLGNCPADEDAARAAASNRELGRRSVLVRNEPFGAGDRIAPLIRLVRLKSGSVPILAVFAAAANVRHDENATPFVPRKKRRGIRRGLRDAVGTVAPKYGWIGAVELDAFLVHDRHRDQRSV